MTLEKAILNEEEIATRQEEDAKYYKASRCDEKKSIACKECAKEHRQTAKWLKELKQLKEQKSVLDKVRTEIEEIIYEETLIEPGSENEYIVSKVEPDDVLAIIDKYRTESEKEEDD